MHGHLHVGCGCTQQYTSTRGRTGNLVRPARSNRLHLYLGCYLLIFGELQTVKGGTDGI